MRLRTGKTISAGNTKVAPAPAPAPVPAPLPVSVDVPGLDTTMDKLNKVIEEMESCIDDLGKPNDSDSPTDTVSDMSSASPTNTVDPSPYMDIYHKHIHQKSTVTIAILQGLVKSAINCSIIERMLKISLIYDIMLADTNFCREPSNTMFMEVVCKEASKHFESIKKEELLVELVSEELVADHKHFYCVLEKFIDGTFGKPADYDEYSYHYDIMKKIGYEEAQNKRTDIFNYAHSVDYDEFLIGEYITNEITVYELYAMVTYNEYEALPNFVDYDYCFETALSWFIKKEENPENN